MAVRMQACMLFAALALCLLVPASEAKKLEWKYCKEDEGAYEAKLDKVVMTPDPAQAGKDINVTINGNIGACVRACVLSPSRKNNAFVLVQAFSFVGTDAVASVRSAFRPTRARDQRRQARAAGAVPQGPRLQGNG